MGINIAICTGRIFLSARHYADLIGINAPVIASNGAFIKMVIWMSLFMKIPYQRKWLLIYIELLRNMD